MDVRNSIVVCIATCALLALGVVILASTSVWTAEGEGYSLLKKQLVFLTAGISGAFFLAFVDYRHLRAWSWWIYGLAVVLLILCYIPGIGKEVNGETRWISLPGIGTFQPSEASKIALMIAMASWCAHYKSEIRSFKKGFIMPGLILGLIIGLIFFEKDMGTAAGLGAAGIALMYVAGTRFWLLAGSSIAALSGLATMVYYNANRMERIMAFIHLDDPEHQLGAGFQQWRALLAFGNGGIEGLGLGNGAEKHGYLPFAHTDFIMAMVGEELGLWFTLGTVALFTLIAAYGIGIGARCQDFFGRLLAVGLTCSIVIPAMVNIGVTTAVLPNTGLPLPFVSYGGTNLVFTLAAIGILVSIDRHTSEKVSKNDRALLMKRRSIKL